MIYMEIETSIDAKCRALMPAVTESMKTAVRSWHAGVMPGHFKRGAARKYGYKKRSLKHQKKKRKMGSPPALVFSGQSRRMLRLPMRITGTRGHVKGAFASNSAMRYFWMIPKNHPNKPQELKTLTDREVARMSEDIHEMTIAKVDAVTTRKKVK